MENDSYDESTNLPVIQPLSRLAIETVDTTSCSSIDSSIDSRSDCLIKPHRLRANSTHRTNQTCNSNQIRKTKTKTKTKAKTKSEEATYSVEERQQYTSARAFYRYSSSSDDDQTKCNRILTIPTIHQFNNNTNTNNSTNGCLDEHQASLCNNIDRRVDDCTITSSSNLAQTLPFSSALQASGLKSTLNHSALGSTGTGSNKASTATRSLSVNNLSNITSPTGSISLIKQQTGGGTLPAVLAATTSVSPMTTSTTSSNHQPNLKSFVDPNSGTAVSTVPSINNQLFRGQENMFVPANNSTHQHPNLMCYCPSATNTSSTNALLQQAHHHHLHHYPSHSSSFHHPLHHFALQSNSSLPTQQAIQQANNNNNSSTATALNQQQQQINGLNGNQSNGMMVSLNSLNSVVNLNSSNNTSPNNGKYLNLNGSPVNQVQIGDSCTTANNNLTDDSLASLQSDPNSNSRSATVSTNKSRKRRKKDKRKFKQNLSSSFEVLNASNNTCSSASSTPNNSPITTIETAIQTPINRFQLNSSLCSTFGQLPNDYFYLNFNQPQSTNQTSNYPQQATNSTAGTQSPVCNSLFKSQNLLNTSNLNSLTTNGLNSLNNLNGLNGLRMDKHSSKKLISIGHFNNSILGHLNQTTNQPQCNLIKQNLLLDARHYRTQQTIQPTAYRSTNQTYCTTNNLTTANYELANSVVATTSTSSNLCTALLTPPHSPAHHLIQNTMDTMFTLNNPNFSSSFQSTTYSSNSVNQTANLFNRNYHFSTFRPHHLQHFELPTQRPPERPWITLRQPNKHRPSCIFTVMCYNVLSDKLVTRQQYGYCPNWALSWDYRRKAIMEEIRNYNADIISLQEVETEKFFNFFKPEMEKMGYDGIFSPKSRAKTMSENERKHVDGCAIFYRCSKFTLVSEHLMEFNQLAMANAEGSDNMLNRVMTKDNIGLAALLQTKENAFEISGSGAPLLDRLNNASSLGKNGLTSVNGNSTNGSASTNGLSPTHAQPLLVTTAHMHWNPEFSDVKLIQTMMLIHELRRIAQQAATTYRDICSIPEGTGCTDPATAIPLVFCADLNSLPASAVVEFLSSGTIAADHVDFKELTYKDCLRKLSTTPESTTQYTHTFKMSKAYPDDLMPYTNYTADFKGVIDYIFYSKAHMNTLGLLGPLDPEWIKDNKIVGCPHPYLPSDHFCLLSEFEMPLQSGGNNQSNQLSNGVLRR